MGKHKWFLTSGLTEDRRRFVTFPGFLQNILYFFKNRTSCETHSELYNSVLTFSCFIWVYSIKCKTQFDTI